jgi:drug/metabolite transporter (DMT)-like permease
MYILMTFLVFAWGMEYTFAKKALAVVEPITLLFLKYVVGFFLLLIVKLIVEGRSFIKKKDIPVFVLCAIFGDIGYFYSEYKAMSFLPVSLITIILAFVPVLSIFIDRIVFKKSITKKVMLGMIFSILGIALIIGVDIGGFNSGKMFGYFLAFSAVIMWNIYNFITASLHEKYDSITLTLNQIICAILLTWPYAFTHMPKLSLLNPEIIGGILYLGIVSTAICFVIMVRALNVLGPTVTAIFSNFLPITTTFFGWLFLNETLSFLQVLGGIIVIASGYYVIKERSHVTYCD